MIEAEVIEDNQVVLSAIKYPVNTTDLEALLKEYKDIPNIDPNADEELVGEQYRYVLAGHKKFVKARNQIEKTRKSLKAPALEYGKKVDEIAKEFQSKIKPTEDKLQFQRKLVEDNEARKQREAEEREEARIAAIEKSLSEMERYPLEMMSKSAFEVREFIVNFHTPKESIFEEFYDKALILYSNIQQQLTKIADDKELVENAQRLQDEREAEAKKQREIEAQKLQAEREEFERQQAELKAKQEAFERQQKEQQEEINRQRAEMEAEDLAKKQEAERVEREKQEAFERQQREQQNKENLENAKKLLVDELKSLKTITKIANAIVSGDIAGVSWRY